MTGTTTVVFTDLAGSTQTTAALGDDGYAAAFTAHVGLLRAASERFNGRVAKLLGDGVMAIFGSAYDGVRAAVAMQQAVERAVAEAARDATGPVLGGLRVGVNVGEVVDGDDDLFGSAIVLARRLCDAASSGQVVVSDLVRLLVGSRTDIVFEPVGPLSLKGIPDPVVAWEVPWEPLRAPEPLRVIVADDATLIRAGVVRLLTSGGFRVVAEAEDLPGLLDAVAGEPPDLVVTDIRMPPTNTDEGLRGAAIIRAEHPEVAVLVLSQHGEARAAAGLLDGRPGGIGYLLKERVSDLDDFLDAARSVAAGGSVIDPVVAEQLVRRRRGDDALGRLTDREKEVLGLMAEGRANGAIAARLGLSPKTVETHVRSIFDKLDLEDNAEEHRRVLAVVRWLEAGR
jgi:DNA-binding NarL/FixJ family response regulator/class 3 adenylate cyclase